MTTPGSSLPSPNDRPATLDLVLGPKSDPGVVDDLLERLAAVPWRGTVYVGFPLVVLPTGTKALDLFLTCRQHGVVVIDIERGAAMRPPAHVAAKQEALRRSIIEVLGRSRRLIVGGRVIVDIHVVTVDPELHAGPPAPHPVGATGLQPAGRLAELPPTTRFAPARYSVRPPPPAAAPLPAAGRGSAPALVVAPADFVAWIRRGADIGAASLRLVNAAVQAIGNVRPARSSTSLGALAGPRAGVLAQIDHEIRNMDMFQKIAAIEMPEGPQRIRGLAGSGKTIVLAFKAALLHARSPQWRVLVTFYTRTMYEPLRDLLTQFHRLLAQKDPDWTRLVLQHAWGDKRRGGTYREMAEHVGRTPVSMDEAKARYRTAHMFRGVCLELLSSIGIADPPPLYDAVLIDEAQDLPAPFFEAVYRMTAPPKRVVWAYDELQNLTEYQMTSPSALFGRDVSGHARVPELTQEDGEARSDIFLPVCYRNTPWALTTAHALGLGVYRRPTSRAETTGLVQFYQDPELWDDLGYVVADGALASAANVRLARNPDRSPAYFTRLMTPGDAVQCHQFATRDEEVTWVADEIATNLQDEGLTTRDILVVSANPYFRADDALPYVRALQARGVRARVAGQAGRVDELFGDESIVPIASVNRAKGSEAAMVYVVQAEYGADRTEVVKRRNALFTAITRSRGWVRITGAGDGARMIGEEVREVFAQGFSLSVRVPTDREMAMMRRLQRDMTRRGRTLGRKGRAGLAALADLARKDPRLADTAVEDLPETDRTAFRAVLRELRRNPDEPA